jgi:hypothetical protein
MEWLSGLELRNLLVLAFMIYATFRLVYSRDEELFRRRPKSMGVIARYSGLLILFALGTLIFQLVLYIDIAGQISLYGVANCVMSALCVLLIARALGWRRRIRK